MYVKLQNWNNGKSFLDRHTLHRSLVPALHTARQILTQNKNHMHSTTGRFVADLAKMRQVAWLVGDFTIFVHAFVPFQTCEVVEDTMRLSQR